MIVENPDLDIPDAPAGIPFVYEDHLAIMFDLMALAFQSEITRVSTFMMARELSNRTYPQVGVNEGHHATSHHANNANKMASNVKIQNYHVTQFKKFIDTLDSIEEGDGTLLDNSMILYGSGMSDGNSHNHDPLPVILAGGASGRLEGNRHIMNPDKTTMSNLLVSMLHLLDIEQDSFGDSDGYVTI